MSDVSTPPIPRLTSHRALPVFPGVLTSIVGAGESGKSMLAGHTVLDVAATSPCLVIDGEMSRAFWRRRFDALGATFDQLDRIHYVEMTAAGADVDTVTNTAAALGVRLIVWDSALAVISRTAKSENDNAEVGRVVDRLRAIVATGPAGLIVDHTASGARTLISRGASAKFNGTDIAFGVRLTDGDVPGPVDPWSVVISVEKDRLGLLGDRSDREATFIPSSGSLTVELVQLGQSTHRLSADNPVTAAVRRLEAMSPPPRSGNEAFRRLGGARGTALAAFRVWKEDPS